MAQTTDLVFNIAKGRAGQLCKNVDDNSPAASRLVVRVFDMGAETDNTIKDCDTLQAVIDLAGSTERTTNGWTPKYLSDTDVAWAVDDTGDKAWVDVVTDITWTAVAGAGGASTALVFCYDASGSDTDSVLLPLVSLLFPVTPDGSDVTAVVAATGIYSAT